LLDGDGDDKQPFSNVGYPNGKAEFARARKALQYAGRLMSTRKSFSMEIMEAMQTTCYCYANN